MKKLFFWIAIIGSIIVLIGSCSSSDSSTTATTTATAACTASTTAAGTISGIDNLTGTFSMSWLGATPTGGCVDNSTALSAYSTILPVGTLGFKHQIVVTSSTAYTSSYQYYSDASCSTSTGYVNYGYTSFAVGDAVTGLTADSSGRPTSAIKVSSTSSCMVGKGETDNATTLLNSWGVGTFTKGTEKAIASATTEVNIWATADNVTGSTKTWLFLGGSDSSTYPSDWASGNTVLFQ